MKIKLHCAKNVLWEWAAGQNGGVDGRYCDGPKGNGVEESCIKDCGMAFADSDDLAMAIGQYVERKMGI